MINCKETFKTKYLTANFSSNIINLVQQGETHFDIAGCMITPDVADTILRLQQEGILFEDSENSSNDALLKRNVEKLQDTVEYVTLPNMEDSETVVEYINRLDKTVVYQINSKLSPLFNFNLVILILYYRPSINVYLSSHLTAFIKYFSNMIWRKNITEIMESTRYFCILTTTGEFEIVVRNPGAKVIRSNYQGEIDIDYFLDYYPIPEYFGKKVIKKDENLHKLLKRIPEDALRELEKKRADMRKSLYNFLLSIQED